MTLNNTDKFLVNRSNSSYYVEQQNLMAQIQNDDLMLVNRGGVSYKVTGAEVIDSFGTPTVVGTPTLLTPIDDATGNKIDSKDVGMTCTAFAGTPCPNYGSTTWQITDDADTAFATPLVNVTNTNETSFNYTGDALSYNAVYRARVRHTSSDSVVSDFSAVNRFITAEEPPTVAASGLRFDRPRLTNLSRSLPGGVSKFTVSMWVKPTELSGTTELLNVGNQDFTVELSSNGAIQSDFNGSSIASANNLVTLNVWTHVLVTYDGTSLKGYLNNTQVFTLSAGAVQLSEAKFDLGHVNGNNTFNGYLSEVYFAEEALLPTAFGEALNNGTWAPLPSPTIKNNINNAPQPSPYDTRANTGAVWSSGLAPGGDWLPSHPITLAFDGQASTYAVGNVLPGLTVNFNNLAFTKLELDATSSGGLFKVNGVDVNSAFSGGGAPNGTFVDVSSLVTSPLTSIQFAEGNPLARVRVDGRVLVDTGVWNVSQNWSGGTIVGATNASGDWPNAFNGSLVSPSTFASGGTSTLTLTTPLAYTNKVEVYGSLFPEGTYGASSVSVNGTVISSTMNEGTGDSDAKWVTALEGSGTLNNITTTNYGLIFAIRVDGAILVDSGATWNTSQVWSDGGDNSDWFSPSLNWNTVFSGSGITSGAATASNTPYVSVGDTAIYTFPSAISGTLKFAATLGSGALGATGEIELSDGQVLDLADTLSTNMQIRGNFTVSNLTGFTIKGDSNGLLLSQVILNNEVLVNKVSFGPSGFYLPFDPTATGAIYTGSYTGSPYEGNWNNVFNGEKGATSVSTVATYTSSGDTTMTLTTPFSGQVTVVASANAGTGNPSGAEVILTRAGGSTSVPCAVLATGNPEANHKIDAGNLTGVTAITLKQAPVGTKLYWLELDGNLLVDYNSIGVDASGNENNFHDQNFVLAGSGQDTVTDTPLMDYAVLNEGNNGNLVASSSTTGDLSYSGSADSKYYYEVDGVGVLVTGSVPRLTNTGTKSFNFGQQPFAASNVTYNQATGLVTLNDIKQPYDYRANTSQVWSSSTSGLNSATSLFDGVIDSTGNVGFANVPGNTTAQVNGLGLSNVTSLELFITGNTDQKWMSDDGTVLFNNSVSGAQWVTAVAPADGILNNITIQSTTAVQTFQGGIKVNGRLLVDQGVWDASQNWSDYTTTNDPSGFASSGLPPKAFDGNIDSYCDTVDSGKTITVTFPGGFAYTNKVEVYVRQRNVNASVNGGTPVQVNGDDTSFAWADVVTGGGTMNTLEVIATTNFCALAGVRVDGEILVNSGVQWNTSQKWSDYVTSDNGSFETGRLPSSAFDGSQSTYCGAQTVGAASNLTWTPLASTFTSSVTVKLIGPGVGVTVSITDGSGSTSTMSGPTANTYTSTVTGIQKIEVQANGAGLQADIRQIIVDGVILVDSDRNVYNTLFQPISQQAGFGILFYDENRGEVQTTLQLANRYGLPPSADITRGIYPLSEQPSYEVTHYTKLGNVYVPNRGYQQNFISVVNALKEASSAWASSTAYTENQLVLYNDVVYRVITAFTSGSSFSDANLTALT